MTEHDTFLAEYSNWVDRVHRSTSDANTPPADLWQQILAQANPQPMETNQMSSLTTVPVPLAPARPVDSRTRGGFGHYMNLVATIALVLAVAVAGWFATMQLNQPGESEPRLALINSTPEIEATPTVVATCNVEPLSTDTVMEIVRNPARFMTNGPTGEPNETPMVGSPPNAELWEVDPDLELTGPSITADGAEFEGASVVANEYLNCLLNGTQGQIWTFYSPVLLQQKILGEFPVFSEESQVRQRVEVLSTQPAYQAEFPWEFELSTGPQPLNPDDQSEWEFDQSIGSLSVNPDSGLARVHQSESSYYEYMLSIGINIEDSEGTQITLTNGTGRDVLPLRLGENPTMLYIRVAKLRHSDTWVIIPWPSGAELGWDQYQPLSG